MHTISRRHDVFPHLISTIAIILLICTVVVLDFINMAEDAYAAKKSVTPEAFRTVGETP